jgi:multisubunit Na+/H+ antiporter MnhE subunit
LKDALGTAGNLSDVIPLFSSVSFLFWNSDARSVVKISPLRFAAFSVVNFAILLGLWFLYTCSFNVSELLAGAGAAALATIGTAVVQEQDFARFSPDLKWFRYFLPLPWTVLKDTVLVFRATVKYGSSGKSDGYLIAVDFNAGGEDPKSAARRAMATTLTNIAPNSIVVGIDRENNKVLLHLRWPADVPQVLRQLGAPE